MSITDERAEARDARDLDPRWPDDRPSADDLAADEREIEAWRKAHTPTIRVNGWTYPVARP